MTKTIEQTIETIKHALNRAGSATQTLLHANESLNLLIIACGDLIEIVEIQQREINRLEREVTPLVKPQPPGVKAGCMDV